MKPADKPLLLLLAIALIAGLRPYIPLRPALAADPQTSATAVSAAKGAKQAAAEVPSQTEQVLDIAFPADKRLGLITYAVRRKDTRGKQIDALQKVWIQGHVRLPAGTSLNVILYPDALNSMAAVEQLKKCRVEDFNADDMDFDDSHMQYLKDFKNLINLSLQDTLVSDKSLPIIGGFAKLRLLHLTRTNVTGVGFKSLAGCKHLENLRINYLNLKQGYLADLEGVYDHMAVLNITHTGLKNEDLKDLKRMPLLVNLDVSSNRDLDNKAIETIAAIRQLIYLQIRGTQINDRVLPLLVGMPGLQYLWIESRTFWITPGANLKWNSTANRATAARLQISDTSAQNGRNVDLFKPH